MSLDRTQRLRIAAFAALCAAATCVIAQEPLRSAAPNATSTDATADAPAVQEIVQAIAPEAAQETAVMPQPPNEPPTEAIVPNPEAPHQSLTEPAGPPASAVVQTNPCADQAELRRWIDKLHSSLYRFSCSSVSWFDGLFGSRQFDDEYRATHGTVTAGAHWSQLEGVDPTLRFRARVYFPQIGKQFNAFIGRADRIDFVQESQVDLFQLPNQFSTGLDESVFMGLGFNEKMKKRGSFDFDVGVRLSDPIDPYAKGSYRFSRPIGERDLLRLRETLFWQQREGFGTSLLLEWNHVFNRDNLLRWTNTGTFSQRSVGMRWYSDLNLYHLVNVDRAFDFELFASGSTMLEVPLTDYGTAVTFRQRVWRKWLFLELRAGVDWPRYSLYQERRLNPNGALLFEMRFGQD